MMDADADFKYDREADGWLAGEHDEGINLYMKNGHWWAFLVSGNRTEDRRLFPVEITEDEFREAVKVFNEFKQSNATPTH